VPREGQSALGARALAVGEGVEQAPVGHQDGFGITRALAETAPHNAQEGLNHFNFAILIHLEDLFGADLDAFAAAIT